MATFLNRWHGQCTFALVNILALVSFTGAHGSDARMVHNTDSLQLLQNHQIFNSRLAALVGEAVEGNRSVKAAQSRIREADAAVKATIGQAPPRFEIAAMDVPVASFPNPLLNQMQMDYSIEQMIMFPGKISTMKRALTRQKEMVLFEKDSRERDIVFNVTTAYYDIYLIDRLIAINHSSQRLIAEMAEIARVRYAAGTGMMPDILRAQTELATLAMKLAEFSRKRLRMTAMINALRAQPVETVIDTIPEILPPQAPASLDSIQTAALKVKPVLQAMRANISMKKEELASAHLEWYPDFMVRATYSDKRPLPVTDPMSLEFGSSTLANPDQWSLMLGVTIPEVPWTLQKAKAERLRAKEAVEGAEEELAEMVNMTSAELYRAFTEVHSNLQRLQITSTSVVPQAELAFESTFSLYKTGSADFTMLLDAERMLLMAHESYQMIVMEYLTSLAALEYASGGSLGQASGSQSSEPGKSSQRRK